MQINAALNLALPIRYENVERPDPEKPGRTRIESEPIVWAFHTPISTETFEANYRIIAETNARIWGKGLKYAATAGARIAALTLAEVARADAEEYDTEDQGPALLADIQRLTLVLAPADHGGFAMLPVDAAVKRGVIEKADWDEVESAIVFFTVGYAMARRAGRAQFCSLISSQLGGLTTSSSATEFVASLRISTPDETSEAQEPSSLPS